jgi:lipopolysaccharide transport system ATP-binding protein
MAAVAALCSKAIVLRQGQVEHPLGDVNEAIAAYLTQVHTLAQTKLSDRTDRQGNGKIRITDFRTFDAQANELEYIATGQEVDLRIYYTSKEDHLENVTASISINSQTGSVMSLLSNEMASAPFQDISGQGSMVCKIKKIPLAPGTYTVNVMIRSNEIIQDWLQEAATLVVEPGDFFGTGRMPPQSHGGVLLEQQWDSFSG